MTTSTLPDPIAAYFAADRRSAADVARCFTPQAVVIDEGRTHVGPDAIGEWKAAASARYTYTTEPFAWERNAGAHVVRCHVAGNFPGSPVDLSYTFSLERGLISSLEIGA